MKPVGLITPLRHPAKAGSTCGDDRAIYRDPTHLLTADAV